MGLQAMPGTCGGSPGKYSGMGVGVNGLPLDCYELCFLSREILQVVSAGRDPGHLSDLETNDGRLSREPLGFTASICDVAQDYRRNRDQERFISITGVLQFVAVLKENGLCCGSLRCLPNVHNQESPCRGRCAGQGHRAAGRDEGETDGAVPRVGGVECDPDGTVHSRYEFVRCRRFHLNHAGGGVGARTVGLARERGNEQRDCRQG